MKQVTINDTTFYIRKMNAFEGLKVFGDLQKEVLPALGGAFDSMQNPQNGNLNADTMRDVVAGLSQALSGDSLATWSNRLLCSGYVSFDAPSGDAIELKKANFDTVFTDFTGILELLVAVILENFKDPLAQLLSRTGLGNLNQAKALAPTEKNS